MKLATPEELEEIRHKLKLQEEKEKEELKRSFELYKDYKFDDYVGCGCGNKQSTKTFTEKVEQSQKNPSGYGAGVGLNPYTPLDLAYMIFEKLNTKEAPKMT